MTDEVYHRFLPPRDPRTRALRVSTSQRYTVVPLKMTAEMASILTYFGVISYKAKKRGFRLSFSKTFLHPLFLFERKRGKKNQKTCRFIALSLRQIAKTSCASPSSIFARTSQNSAEPRGEIMLHGFSVVCKRAIGANSFYSWNAPFSRK